jgi:hypothetical protein
MTVSTQNSNNPGGFTRPPEANLYTVLLIFALLALLIGILYLHLDMNIYQYKSRENIPSYVAAVAVPSPDVSPVACVVAASWPQGTLPLSG